MYIQKIIKEIWKNHYDEVKQYMEKFNTMDVELLHKLAIEQCMKMNIVYYQERDFVQNIIPSIGCTKCFHNYPCSFCNFHLEQVEFSAIMQTLREKSVEKYVDILVFNFKKIRGSDKVTPRNIELFAVRDFFNEYEFPKEAFDALLSEDGVFTRKPYYGSVFTGGASITPEKIRRLKNAFRKNVTIIIGVEVESEWIRRYWLNKSVSNKIIEKNIGIIAKEKAHSGATILLGLPGLTDLQSIELLMQTIKWLNSLPVNYIQIGYLVRKQNTVQEFIYKYLRNDFELNEIGVAKYEKTGMLDIIILYDTIMKIYQLDSNIYKRIVFSAQNFIDNAKIYNNSKVYGSLTELERKLLNNILKITSVGIKNIHQYIDEYEGITKTEEYHASMKKLKSQQGLSNIKDTMRIVGKKIAEVLFDVSNQALLLSELESDLNSGQ